jgi:hypothetical protein
VLGTFLAAGCSQSPAAKVRDHAEVGEKKLEAERDRALADQRQTGSPQDARLSHLQTLRLGLSMVNVSAASIPLLLSTDDQRTIGYSVLDEALGTIDWNIPLYQSTQGVAPREYPTLFSPQMGLDFNAIRSGQGPHGFAK